MVGAPVRHHPHMETFANLWGVQLDPGTALGPNAKRKLQPISAAPQLNLTSAYVYDIDLDFVIADPREAPCRHKSHLGLRRRGRRDKRLHRRRVYAFSTHDPSDP